MELREHGRQAMYAERFRGADGQRACRLVAGGHGGARFVCQPQHPFCIRQQTLPGLAQGDPPAQPLEERAAQLRLQLLDLG